MGAAVASIQTAEAMAELPKAAEAFKSGKLTLSAATEIAQAATLDPSSEKKLLEVAKTDGIAGVRQEARRVIAQSCADEKQKAERIHKARCFRSWTDREGAWRFEGQLTPEAGGEVKAVMDSLQEKLFLQARKQGAKVPTQALMADALVEMARSYRDAKGGRGGPKCLATLRVDYSALKRGHTKEGEVCEIAGVGPVSAAVAKDYLSDCIFKVLVTKGKDVLTLAHGGYNITASLRSFLDETYPTCVVLGCNETRRLEIDHVIPWPEGPSAPWNTVQICNRHHYLKTYKGYTLGPRVNGKAELIPPNKSRSRASPSE